MEKQLEILSQLLDKLKVKYPDNKELGLINHKIGKASLEYYIQVRGVKERIERFQKSQGVKQCII